MRSKDIQLKSETGEAARQRDIVAEREAEIVALKKTIAKLRETVVNKGEQMRNVRVEDGYWLRMDWSHSYA